jgi:hypothetical protein
MEKYKLQMQEGVPKTENPVAPTKYDFTSSEDSESDEQDE